MRKYKSLLSPIKIGNVILKSRICQSKSSPHFLQGPEDYIGESLISHYAQIARNGAAYVTVNGAGFGPVDRGAKPQADMARAIELSLHNPANENYFSMCADAIHFYDSKACIAMLPYRPEGYSISKITREDIKKIKGVFGIPVGGEIPREMIKESIEEAARTAKYYKELGFDMINLYAPYRSGLLACSLSPVINKRTDEYGGCLENRCRYILEMADAIKKACGQDFLIEVPLSGEETDAGGFTMGDTAAFAKLAEGKIDIFQVRGFDMNRAHPTGFNSERRRPMSLHAAEAIKKSGAKVVVAANGGYQNLDDIEEYIAAGKTDMVSMARPFICDFDYYRKALEGRGDDVVPCIRCNKCHVPSLSGPWYSLCSTNPKLGLNHRLNRMIDAETAPKRVAVIGGGPAGMRAALFARERGHDVTLYEKTGVLGGQMKHADYAKFKWPVKDYKDYLIYQLDKNGVNVVMNTEPDSAVIEGGQYRAVIAALGAVPRVLDVPGAEEDGVWAPIDVFGRESELGENVVIVGGSETGAETGLYLAECGHNVTILTRQNALATDATPIHYVETFSERWEALDNFSYITNAVTTEISGSMVTYTDAEGSKKTISADSVVVSGGVRPLQDEALRYSGLTDRFSVIGDARSPGNIHLCNRGAFSAACQI